MEFWDPDRVATVGSIVQRVAPYLKDNMDLRLEQEGDPCNPYKNPSDAPCGTTRNVKHHPDGLVTFDLDLKSGGTVSLDNRNIQRVWEVSPDYVDTFRGIVEDMERERRAAEEAPHEEAPTHEAPTHEAPAHEEAAIEVPTTNVDHLYRGLERSMEELREQLDAVRDVNAEFRSTMLDTVKHFALDCQNLKAGKPMEFMDEYLRSVEARGDAAAVEATTPEEILKGLEQSSRHDFVLDEYRGASEKSGKRSDARQQEKYSWGQDVTPLTYGKDIKEAAP